MQVRDENAAGAYKTKVYPFIIDKITDRRDSHFSIYKDIEASGMAFAELGKQGYKLELNSHTLETDYEKDLETVATVDYWLDKVFPNERDAAGNVIKWLTPWSYEIRMDWSHYSAEDRLSSKVYEDPYIGSWTLDEGEGATQAMLRPGELVVGEEKARYIDCKNSNKYNITQTIAETYGIFCVYEYVCDERGRFKHEYTENGQVWTGRKAVFYNRAIKADNPFYIEYQNNLGSISRVSDSSEIYSKLYITPIQSKTTETGYVSIADTSINPILDDFILNFDYLYNTGSISDYQRNFIKTYEVALYKINSQLINLSPEIENLTVEVNNTEAEITSLENEIQSARESLVHYQTLRENAVTNQTVVKNKDNAYSVIFLEEDGYYSAQLRLEGINASTIKGYRDYKYENRIFDHVTVSGYRRTLSSNDDTFYVLLDDYGYPCELYTSLSNSALSNGKSGLIYLSLEYSPKNAYAEICSQLQETINRKAALKTSKTKTIEKLKAELESFEDTYDNYLSEKAIWNNKLELVLGPALREGYWTPDSYEDPGEKLEVNLTGPFKESYTTSGAQLIYDNQYFSSEEKGYYSDDPYNPDVKEYYSYIEITSELLEAWKDKEIKNLVIHLKDPDSQTGYLNERLIYENAGFIFAFIKLNNTSRIIPVLLLNDNTIDYRAYTNISYSFQGVAPSVGQPSLGISGPAAYTLYYPRIAIFNDHVNYLSDNLKIATYKGSYDEKTAKLLEKYEDYHILSRHGKPYFTLKVTNTNTLDDILNGNYYIKYQLSRANEMLYLDAKDVARENSQPRYSYELEITNVPDQVKFIDLGQLAYINDHSLGIHAATGYVSSIKYALDKPQDDEITIQNYKTKFEDLFSTITASSEAMKNNSVSYNIAAGAFTSNGQIEGSVLQNSINNNNVSFNYSNTNVVIDPDQGIILTNTSPYMNGVYGQVALRGGGIFLSDSIDGAGGRIWSTGITPTGINASMITTGQLDTETIRIFSGSNLAFQWNAEGIFAYQRNEEGIPDMNTYVKYSDKGLQYVRGNNTEVDLGWNGLLISTQDGSTELTGDKGLVVYYGPKNDAGNNYAARLGKFEDEGIYGLRLYNQIITTDENGQVISTSYEPVLTSSTRGELWLKNTLRVGTEIYADGSTPNPGIAGITGAGTTEYDEEGKVISSPIRFWAGDSNMDAAPFWVREDGSMQASNAIIFGQITAESGAIGGWKIDKTSLISSTGETKLSSEGKERINVNNKFIVNADGSMEATEAKITGEIYATGGEIGGMKIDSLEQDLENIIGDTNLITVVISSSRGTVANLDKNYITRFEATAYKGNVEFIEEDYNNYIYYWEYSSTGEDNSWNNLISNMDEEDEENFVLYTEVPYYDYSGRLSSSTFIRCRLVNKTTEGGESIE